MSIDSSARYQENKKRLRKKVYERYQDLLWRIKKKEWECGCEWYKNLPEHEKQRLARWVEKK